MNSSTAAQTLKKLKQRLFKDDEDSFEQILDRIEEDYSLEERDRILAMRDADGFTLLHHAIVNENKLFVDYLINELGTNPNLAAADGDTPLILAVSVYSPEIVRILLTRRDINTTPIDRFGGTARVMAEALLEDDEADGLTEKANKMREIVRMLSDAERRRPVFNVNSSGIAPAAGGAKRRRGTKRRGGSKRRNSKRRGLTRRGLKRH